MSVLVVIRCLAVQKKNDHIGKDRIQQDKLYSVSKWSKHDQTSPLVPGHNPAVDITIYLDVSRNPGPNSLAMNSNPNVTLIVNLHVNSTIKTYTRNTLIIVVAQQAR